ncbi:uncharacterized protein LOC122550712 isoform X2 [Chiloscyllium plagiosum]|uniref:uncharacterized protein LOC122550712 isoform X2 n=1 Tax=Chiloscyllium plagiosum TaxID=36176 RepID=UPI001CB7CC9D|nr:uncharacterized protein LOC122550712 isoform X2 [Chiloscyllium plagiosum]
MFYRKTSASKHSVDLSFLSNEEVSAILDVLERDKELQRMNNDRLKEIKKKNPDKLWLKGITGQWFEEIRRAKFKDQTDLTQILKGSHIWNLKKNRTGNSREDANLDPVSRPSEFANQDIQSQSEQNKCSNYSPLQLETPNMFQQIQVRLKAAAVPHVERKIHVFRDLSKQIQSNILSQDLETNNIADALNKHEMILETEDLSNTELQRNITHEKDGKSYDHLTEIHRSGKTNTVQNSSELSENTREQALPVEYNIEASQQQCNACALIGTGQCEADNSVLPKPASHSQSSIIESKNVFQNHPMNNAGNILTTNINGCLSSNHSKTDAVYLKSKNKDLLQNDESEECSATGIIITESPNYLHKAFASQSLSLTSSALNLERCSKQNDKQEAVTTLSTDQVFSYKFPIPNNYKYRLFSDSVKCTDITVDRKCQENKSDPKPVLSLTNSKTSLSNSTENSNSTKIHGADNVQNYKSETIDTSPSVVVMQYLSTITNKNKSSTNYSKSGSNSETIKKAISETANEEQPTRTITPYLNQNTSFTFSFSSGGNKNLSKCDASNKPAAQDLQCDQMPLPNFTVGQDKSLTHFLLHDNTIMDPGAIKYTESYQSEKKISVPPQIIATSQPSPNTHFKANKLLIHLPVKSDLIKNSENEHSENYKAVLISDADVDLKTHSAKAFQNRVQNTADTTRGITRDYNRAYEFKMDGSPSGLDTAFNQSLLKDNTFLNEHKPLCYSSNRVHTTGNRKSPDSLHTEKTSQQLTSNIIHINQKKQLVHPLLSNDTHVHGEHSQILQENKSESHSINPSPEMLTVLHFTTTSTDIKKVAMHNDSSEGTEIAHNQKSCDRNEENYQSENHGEDSQSRMIGQRTLTNITPGQNLYPDNLKRRFNKSETPHASSTIDLEIGQQFSTNIAHRHKYLSQNYARNSLHVILDGGGNKHLEKDSTEPTLPSSVTGQQTSTCAHNKINPPTNFPLSADSTLDTDVIRNTERYQSEESSPIVLQDTLTDQRSPTNSISNLDKPLPHSLKRADMELNENFQKQQAKTGSDTAPLYSFSPNHSTTNMKKNTLWHYVTKVTDIYHNGRLSAKLHKTKSAPSPSSAETSQSLLEDNLQSHNQKKSKAFSLVRNDIKLLADCGNIEENQSDKYCAGSTLNRQWTHQDITAGRIHSPNFDDITMVSKINKSCAVDKSETESIISPLDRETSHLSHTDSSHRHEHRPVTYLLNSAAVSTHRESPNYLEKCKEEPKSSDLADDKTPQQKSITTTDIYKDKPLSHSSVITVVSAVNQTPALDPVTIYNTSKNINVSSKYKTTTDIKKDALQNDPSKMPEILHENKSFNVIIFKTIPAANSASSSLAPVTSQSSPTTLLQKSHSLTQSQLEEDIMMDRGCIPYLQKDHSHLSTSDSLGDQLFPANGTCDNNTNESHSQSLLFDHLPVGPEAVCNVESYQSENHGWDSAGRPLNQRTPTNIRPGKENIQQNVYPDNNCINLNRGVTKNNVQHYKSGRPHMSSMSDSEIEQVFSTNIAQRHKYQSQNYAQNSLHVILDGGGNKHLEKDSTEPTLPSSVTDQQTSTCAHNKINPLTHFPLSADSILDVDIIRKTEHCQFEESSPIVSQATLTDQISSTNSISNLDKSLPHSLGSGDIEIDEKFQKQQAKPGSDTASLYLFSPNRTTANVKKNTWRHYITKVTDIYHHRRPSAKFKLNVLHKTKSAPLPSCVESSQLFPKNSLQSNNQEESKAISLVRDDMAGTNQEESKAISLVRDDMAGTKEVEHQSDKDNAISTADELNGQWIQQNITEGKKNMLDVHSPNIDDITVVSEINNFCAVDKSETESIISPQDQEFDQFSPTDGPHRHEHRPATCSLNSAVVNAHRESPNFLEKCNEEPKSADLAEDKTPQQKSVTTTDSYKDEPLSHSPVTTVVSAINQNSSHISSALDSVSSYNTSKNTTDSSKYKAINISISLNNAPDITDIREHLQNNLTEINKIPAVYSLNDIQSVKSVTDIKKDALQNDSSQVPEILHDNKSFNVLTFNTIPAANSAPSSLTSQSFPVTLLEKSHSLTQSQLNGDVTMDRGHDEYLHKNHSHRSTPDSLGDQLFPVNGTCDNTNESHSQSLLFDHLPVGPGAVCNAKNYQSENHGRDSAGRLISQRTPTNITTGKGNIQQNVYPDKNYINLNRRFTKDNVQHYKLGIPHISSTSDSKIEQELSTDIAQRHKYQSQNYSPHNKMNPLINFPLSAESTLDAEVIKNTKHYRSEESSLTVLQDTLTDQRSPPNSIRNIDKPLPHSLESDDVEIDENFQKQQAKTGSDTAPLYPFSPNHSTTNVKKNTLQQCITKVTDIYRRRRPSAKFKFNVLRKTKSSPSPRSAESSQLLPESSLQSSNQEESKALSLVQDDMAGSRKCQPDKDNAISTAEELNGQWTHQNITSTNNMLQSCSPNIDGITVDRKINNVSDVDKFETECMPSPLNQVYSQSSLTDTPCSHKQGPATYLLNSAAVSAHRESPAYLKKCKQETVSTTSAEGKVAQQKSPTCTADRQLCYSSVTKDVNTINQDKFTISQVLPALDPVSSHHSSKNIIDSSKSKTLGFSLNDATVTADTGVNEHLQKDSSEMNNIPALGSLSCVQSTITITNTKKNTTPNVSSHLTEIHDDKKADDRLKFKGFHKKNSAPSSQLKVTEQMPTTDITLSNHEKSPTHSIMSGAFIMNRRKNSYLQKNKPETNNEFSLVTSLAGQQSPSKIINNKEPKSPAHSPNRSGVMDAGDSKNLEFCQPENNREAFSKKPIDLQSYTDITDAKTTKFQHWFPDSDISLNQRCSVNLKHYKSETDISSSIQDPIHQMSFIDMTCHKKITREPMKSDDFTLAERYNKGCEHIDSHLNNNISSSHNLLPALLSPENIVHYNRNVICDHSLTNAEFLAQSCDNVNEGSKTFKYGRKSFHEEIFQNQALRMWMKNTKVSNSFQQCSPEESQIDSHLAEINNFRNRLNAYSDFSQYRATSSGIDEDDPSKLNNKYQAKTARFSKTYPSLRYSLRPNPQNVQSWCGNLYKTKSLKDINCNQSTLQDHENVFSTNRPYNFKPTVQKKQVNTRLQFSNQMKSNRLYRSYSDLPFSGENEFDQNNWVTDHSNKFSFDNHDLEIGNKDKTNVSKEEKRKETHLENMKRVLVVDRLWKPGYLHSRVSSPRNEDVFNPLTSEINQDPGVNDDTERNHEYFPVDIKLFWPKENPTDIIRLLSSSSTGSKVSENSLSPHQQSTPVVVDKQNFSCYSESNSDTTTDDEYFLDSNEIVKESML